MNKVEISDCRCPVLCTKQSSSSMSISLSSTYTHTHPYIHTAYKNTLNKSKKKMQKEIIHSVVVLNIP